MRVATPALARLTFLLTLILGAAAPSFWAGGLDGAGVPGAHARGADAQTGAMTVAGQEGDATPTPLAPPADDPSLIPPPNETPTPTMTLPPPPPPPTPPQSPSR